MENSWQVFLSYHSADRAAVEEIAVELRRQGIRAWFDEWELIAGEPFQPRLAEVLRHSESIAVFVGPGPKGPWQAAEVQLAINRQIAGNSPQRQRVIPVLLPGGQLEDVPDFLEINTLVRFPFTKDPEALRRLIAAVEGRPPGPSPEEIPVSGENPYRGLEPFLFEHAKYFAGREAVVDSLLKTIAGYLASGEPALLGILGDSGTGKSSLARAGLLPALAKGIPPMGAWRHAELKPGSSPLHSLALALLSFEEGPPDLLRAGDLKRRLAGGRTELAETVSTLLAKSPETRFALLVDQFEETFSMCPEAQERMQFIAALAHAATVPGGRTLILLTLRTDFYGACAKYDEFAAVLNRHHILLPPMSDEELAVAIEQPAWRAGYEMEPGLAAVLLRDARDQPGSLPLLQFALDELWHRRTGRAMTLTAYGELGGLSGALNHRADELFERFTAEQQAAARKIMLRLVKIGEDGKLLRARVAVDELCSPSRHAQSANARQVLDALSHPRSRLLTITAEAAADGRSYVEVAHEALIRSWKKMTAWLDEGSARQFVVWRQRLQEWLSNWRESGESPDACLRGTMLDQAVNRLDEHPDEFSESEARFILASREAHAADLTVSRRRRLLQWTLGSLCAAAVAALVFVIAHRPPTDPRIGTARSLLESNPELAMVIALRANLSRPTEESNTLLQDAFQAATEAPVEHGTGPISAIAFSSDGQRIATGSGDGTAALWDTDHRLLGPRPAGSAVLAVSTAGNRLMAASADGVWTSWSPRGDATAAVKIAGHLIGAAFSDKGDVAGITSEDRVCIWKPESQTPEHCQPVTPEMTLVAFAGDGDPKVAVAGRAAECVLWNPQSGVTLSIPLKENMTASVTFDAAGKLLATVATAGPARLWDAMSGVTRGLAIRPNGQNLTYAALSGDGNVLATSNVDGSIAIWSVARESLERLLRGPHSRVVRLAFAPRGRRLAVADDRGGVRLYELENADLNRVACRQEWALRKSPEDRYLADCARYLDARECALDCREQIK
jgi:hypothetical protein